MIKNYLYNLMYQIITVIAPIITVPYVSRILGPEGLGKYSLTNAYANYFVLFGMVGLTLYCSREIAYVRDSIDDLSKTFWELNFLRFITMGISIIVYIITIIFIVKREDKLLYSIQLLILWTSLFDISWLFIGLEDFKKVSIRNSIVKISGVILVFIFVKDRADIWLYALILSGTQFIGQIVMWFDIPQNIKFILPYRNGLTKHMKYSLKLFIPQIAINVYTMLDKIMLGNITNESQVGIYDNSQRIINISIMLVTTVASVTVPKMSNLYKNKNIKLFCENVYRSFSFVSCLAFAMSFGLIGICKNFTPWFYGTEFDGINNLFYFGSWVMISLAWSSIIGNQVLLAAKRERMYTIAVTSGAVVNVLFNIILIKRFEAVGTMISSVLAEFTGMFIMVYSVRDILNIKKLFRDIPKYFISSFIMFLIVCQVGNFVKPTILGTIIQIIIGILVYMFILIKTHDDNLVYMLNLVKNKVFKLKTA